MTGILSYQAILQNSVIYQLKALDNFFNSFLNTELASWSLRLLHETTKRTSKSGKAEKLGKNLQKQ